MLSDPAPHVRIAAVRAVTRCAARPGDLLAVASGDEDRLVRLEVARRLASRPAESAARLLADPELRVREAGALAAGRREISALGALLTGDRARDVRRAAARTLGSLRDPRLDAGVTRSNPHSGATAVAPRTGRSDQDGGRVPPG